MFNSFGNLMVNPRAGLTFIDFDSGDVLQLTGVAVLVLLLHRIAEPSLQERRDLEQRCAERQRD